MDDFFQLTLRNLRADGVKVASTSLSAKSTAKT